MNQNDSFRESYSALNIEPGCSWAELRKQYKSLSQKWHPDRHENDENSQKQAVDKFKEINLAFQQLENYYKEQGTLPNCSYGESDEKLQGSKYYGPITPDVTVISPENNTLSNSTRLFRTWGIASIAAIYVTFLVIQGTENSDSQISLESAATSIEQSQLADSDSTPSSSKGNPQSPHPDDIYFTYNSTIGDVINIQGQPDLINNNTWYYGKSEVHFQNGRVVRWFRDPATPLKARINQTTRNN